MANDVVPRYMIEGCLNDELDIMYDPIVINGETIPMSEIIHTCRPKLYEEFVEDYCIRENITVVENDGDKEYIQM